MRNKIIFIFIVVLIAVQSNFAQDKTQNSIYGDSEYAYHIGERVTHSLVNKCSILTGKIDSLDDSNVKFSVDKVVFGKELQDRRVIARYDKPGLFSSFQSETYSPWIKVDVEKGKNIIFSKCGSRYGLIVSDEKLFQDIMNSISHFNTYQKDSEILLDSTEYIDKYNSPLFSGYVIYLLSRLGSNNNKNISALALASLIKEEKIPDVGFTFVLFNLQRLLIRRDSLDTEFRNKVLTLLVNTASSKKSSSIQATRILIISNKNNDLNLKKFLNKEKSKIILQNINENEDKLLKQFSNEQKSKFEQAITY